MCVPFLTRLTHPGLPRRKKRRCATAMYPGVRVMTMFVRRPMTMAAHRGGEERPEIQREHARTWPCRPGDPGPKSRRGFVIRRPVRDRRVMLVVDDGSHRRRNARTSTEPPGQARERDLRPHGSSCSVTTSVVGVDRGSPAVNRFDLKRLPAGRTCGVSGSRTC